MTAHPWRVRSAVAAAVALLFLAGGVALVRSRAQGVEGWDRFVPMSARPGPDEAAVTAVLLGPGDAQARFDALAGYFIQGFLRHVSASGERVNYAGAGSTAGYRMNGLEGFARTAPLLAAWIGSGRGDVLGTGPGAADLVAVLRKGLLAGTDRAAPSYWGDMQDFDQRIAEAADIARTLWLTRRQLWDRLSKPERAQIAGWLRQANGRRTVRNNWLLFPVVIDAILADLGEAPFGPQPNYEEFKTHYVEQGWFFDDPGVVDFYNAWGITYDLFWIHRAQPSFDPAFLTQTLAASAELTAHLVAPEGVPIMGRSVCYRTAIAVPPVAWSLADPTPATAALGLRVLDATWRYFVAGGSLRDGGLTQGYLDIDLRFLDSYSGPGSCHWGLRSLVLALMHPRGDAFWTAPPAKLPVEGGDFTLDLPRIGWVVQGTKATGEIAITIPKNPETAVAAAGFPIWRRWKEALLQYPQRPNNHEVAYHLRRYASRDPFTAR